MATIYLHSSQHHTPDPDSRPNNSLSARLGGRKLRCRITRRSGRRADGCRIARHSAQPPPVSAKLLYLQGLSSIMANYVSLGRVRYGEKFKIVSCAILPGCSGFGCYSNNHPRQERDVLQTRLSSVFFEGSVVLHWGSRNSYNRKAQHLAAYDLFLVVLYGPLYLGRAPPLVLKYRIHWDFSKYAQEPDWCCAKVVHCGKRRSGYGDPPRLTYPKMQCG